MRRQLHIFLTAVMFYTRLPCPAWVDHSEDLLNKATVYFPVIGWLVGILMLCLTPIAMLMVVIAMFYYGYQAYQGKRFANAGYVTLDHFK